MRVSAGGLTHLAIALRAGNSSGWTEQFESLSERVRSLRRALGHGEPVGLSLQLPALAAFELYDRDNLAALKALLEEYSFYVFSLDGTEFGERGMPRDEHWGPHFPDWRDMRRMAYCNVLADILAELLPDDVEYGSITTLAIAGRDAIPSEELPAAARNVLRFAAYLHMLGETSGKRIMLALQPAPGSIIETAVDAARFFRDYLYSPIASAHFSSAASLTAADADAELRNHLGVCVNSSHLACQFESPEDSLNSLHYAGVAIVKLVLANALTTRDPSLLKQLPPDTAIGLSPVVHRVGGDQWSYPDLKAAIAATATETKRTRQEWRIACHAPVSQGAISPFGTTQSSTVELLQARRAEAGDAHLELNVDSLADGRPMPAGRLVRELQWVLDTLGQTTSVPTSSEGFRPRRRRPPKLELAGLFR